jgi:hypothetical protein
MYGGWAGDGDGGVGGVGGGDYGGTGAGAGAGAGTGAGAGDGRGPMGGGGSESPVDPNSAPGPGHHCPSSWRSANDASGPAIHASPFFV